MIIEDQIDSFNLTNKDLSKYRKYVVYTDGRT